MTSISHNLNITIIIFDSSKQIRNLEIVRIDRKRISFLLFLLLSFLLSNLMKVLGEKE